VLRRAAPHEELNAAPGPGVRRGGGGRAAVQQRRQRQPGQAEAADVEELAARHAVTQPGAGTAKVEHDNFPRRGLSPGAGGGGPAGGPATTPPPLPSRNTRRRRRCPPISPPGGYSTSLTGSTTCSAGGGGCFGLGRLISS